MKSHVRGSSQFSRFTFGHLSDDRLKVPKSLSYANPTGPVCCHFKYLKSKV